MKYLLANYTLYKILFNLKVQSRLQVMLQHNALKTVM